MTEKRPYIEPSLEIITIAETESTGSGACEPEGTIPPEICGPAAPFAVADPASS